MEHITSIQKALGQPFNSAAFAARMDAEDELSHLRNDFIIPLNRELEATDASVCDMDAECVYFCGNSLGLQPKRTRELVAAELTKWGQCGVNGHFTGERPWVSIDETVTGASARIVGAEPQEVAIMNTLTVNLHLLMAAFYRPTDTRYKILMEAKAFPSDQQAMASQVLHHGRAPRDCLIEMTPRGAEDTLRTEDILRTIEQQGDRIAVVMFSGIQFYTGQCFDMARITKAAQAKGCIVGFDLAHAVGNVVLKLHDWGVDFACWCTYKYLNAGPGGIAGAFIHSKHHGSALPGSLRGWWGVEPSVRFKMAEDPPMMAGVRGLQLSNPGVLQTVSLLGSLETFEKTNMATLRKKAERLTAYLEVLLLRDVATMAQPGSEVPVLRIITPSDPAQRGCQLSVLFSSAIRPVFDEMERRGIVCDIREPNVMRLAPLPLYTRFEDVRQFVTLMRAAFETVWEREEAKDSAAASSANCSSNKAPHHVVQVTAESMRAVV